MSTQPLVLVAEDEDLMRAIVSRLLEESGYRVAAVAGAEEALEVFAAEDVAVTLTDIRMAGMDGLALLDRLKDIDPEALVVVMTAYSSVDSAVAALRKGAYDYITKPFVNEDLLQSVKNALRQRELFRENRALRRELDRRYSFSEIIGTSESLQQVFRLVEKVAATNTNILVYGESGTGKELVARAIHHNSPRADRPFVARHFVKRTAREQGQEEKPIEPSAMTALINYAWPGNVRELQNAIERAFTLSGDQIDLDSLPPRVRDAASSAPMRDPDGLRPTLAEIERRHIFETLASVNQDKARAANILGIDLSTLYRKLKRYDAV